MTTAFEDEYYDELLNIELAITESYRQQGELTDHDVIKVLEGLTRYYNASVKGTRMPNLRFSNEQQALFDRVKLAGELALAGDELVSLMVDESNEVIEPRTPQEVVQCLKRILRSVNLHTKSHGRRGYLDFVDRFFRKVGRD